MRLLFPLYLRYWAWRNGCTYALSGGRLSWEPRVVKLARGPRSGATFSLHKIGSLGQLRAMLRYHARKGTL